MPTFETIKKHARCWSDARLRERAKLWPDPLTWAWFLGERCEKYTRDECLEFLSVAVSHIQQERVELPMSVREIWQARRSAEKTVLLDAMFAIGEYLDHWDGGGRESELRSEAYVQLTDALHAFTNHE